MNRQKKQIINLFILITIATGAFEKSNAADQAITYNFSGGRFGDNLLSYIIGKYFSWKYKLPLLYRPFNYSNNLKLHIYETPIATIDLKRFSGTENIDHYSSAWQGVYTADFYSNGPDWKNTKELVMYIKNNSDLQNEIKRMVAPINPISFYLPENMISVAVHVRRGGGFDRPLLSGTGIEHKVDRSQYADGNHPLKFPPDEFYLNQIQFLYRLHEERPLYVYIFTDDKNPADLTARYKAAINRHNVTFDYYRIYEPFNYHLIHDLFFMKEFDCLIRPESSLSIVAQIIGDHKIVLSPSKSHWEDNDLIIDQVLCTYKKNGQFVEHSIEQMRNVY